LNYKITLNDDFYKIVSFLDEKAKILEIISIITDENRIKNLIQNEKYLKLVEYKKSVSNNNTEIYISFYFSDKEKLSFQFKNFIFPVYIVEENKIVKCRVVISPDFLGDPEKLRVEYRYFIPKIIESETFEKEIIPQIKLASDKNIILKLYIKSQNNNYIFESNYPNIEKFKNDRINELRTVSQILNDIKFKIKEKEIFNSYASLIKFKFTYKLPKDALITSQSQSFTFLQTRREAKTEYSLIDLLSASKIIENEISYKRD